jgi:hypothetical protein
MTAMVPRAVPPGDATRWIQKVLQQLRGRRSVPQAARLDRPTASRPMPMARPHSTNPFDVQRMR